MKLEDVQQKIKEGKAEFIPQAEQPPQKLPEFDDLAKMVSIFAALRKPRYHLTSAPTVVPKSLLDQIQFYDDGTNRRLYLFINQTWRYVALT